MKPLIVAFLLVILTVLISACGTDPVQAEGPNASENESSEDEIFEFGTRIGIGGDRECLFDSDCPAGEACIDKACSDPKDIRDCDDIEHDLSMHKCIRHIAVKNNDVDICRSIVTAANQYSSVEEDCYVTLAIMNADDSLCDIYVEIKGRNGGGCYKHYAFETLNRASCDKIPYDPVREECIRRLEILKKHPELTKDDLTGSSWFTIAKKTDTQEYCQYASWFSKRDCEAYFSEEP